LTAYAPTMMNRASASNNARMMSRKSGFIVVLQPPLFLTQLPGQPYAIRGSQPFQELPLRFLDFLRRTAHGHGDVLTLFHCRGFYHAGRLGRMMYVQEWMEEN
jgi:hypothetical protein